MLTICPTPIGNLADITERQRNALAAADVIACEDTRRTGKLLELLGISRVDGRPRLVSYHEHNEAERAAELVARIEGGAAVVLVSDAGTPTISDPGYRLVHAAIEAGLQIEALPGPMAGVVALSASGLPTDRFVFEGFLPAKQNARRERLEALRALERTAVLYESPYRLVELLEDVVAVYGPDHPTSVGRELTKMHEEYVRGGAGRVRDDFASREEIHGEVAVVLGPAEAAVVDAEAVDAAIDKKIAELLDEGMRPRGIKEVVSELYDVRKSELYDRIERVKEEAKK